MKNAFLISQITITICLLTGLCGIGQGWAQTNTTADLGISLMNVTPSSAQPGTFILEATVTNLGPDDTGLVKGTIQESFELLEFINVKANKKDAICSIEEFPVGSRTWEASCTLSSLAASEEFTIITTARLQTVDQDFNQPIIAIPIAQLNSDSNTQNNIVVLRLEFAGVYCDERLRESFTSVIEHPDSTPGYLMGTPHEDLILGNSGNDLIIGLGGNDCIFGRGGDDVIAGRQGDDEIHGGQGDDVLLGNNGNDRLFGDDGKDRMFGGNGADIMYGNLGDDVIFGREGNDTLHGNEGNDVIHGNQGNDTIYGDAGHDVLLGGLDDDNITGGQDQDVCDGVAGSNIVDCETETVQGTEM